MTDFKTILVADGVIANPKHWTNFSYTKLICTDGAALLLQQIGQLPGVIIGDFDKLLQSYSSLTLIQLQFPHAELHQHTEQNSTDFEKSLIYASQKTNFPVLCLGLFGQALDHSLHNLSLFAQYAQKAGRLTDWIWLNEEKDSAQWGFLLPPACALKTQPGQTISFYPFHEAKITTEGLKWELKGTTLTQKGPHSVRNLTLKDKVVLRTEGVCFVIVTAPTCPALQLI